MAIKKGNVMLQVSVSKKIVEGMNIVCKSISKQLNRPYTKGNLITDMYSEWVMYHIQKVEEAEKEEK